MSWPLVVAAVVAVVLFVIGVTVLGALFPWPG